jgi:DNA-binding transcriptional LysR family regulator
MELYQIRHYVAIVETGSFTKAAKRVAVTQPALSASVAKLEEELGVRLLYRGPKGRGSKVVGPTPEGRRFLSMAREVLAACHKLKADLRASTINRPLRIGVLRTLPTPHVVRLVDAFRRALPDSTIELYDGSRQDLENQLSQGKLIACITSTGPLQEGQRSAILAREGYGLVVGLQHRFAMVDSISLDELEGEPFIVRTHCETFAATTQLLSDRGIRTRIVYKTDQDDRALALIAAGLGVALMPALYNAPDVRKIKVRDFDVQRVIELRWNADTVDDRLETVISFASSHNWLTIPLSVPARTIASTAVVRPALENA